MFHPERYIKENEMQRKAANDVLNKFIKLMKWEPNEIVLDIGCGTGDVTENILYPLIKNNIQQLVGVDKSKEMITYAKKTYGSKIDFNLLDIGNYDDCVCYKNGFKKIFSFHCLNWICDKYCAANNIYSMLKNDGENLIHFMLTAPHDELYQYLDLEWQTYVQSIKKITQFSCTREEIEDIFIKVGFKIIKIEVDTHKFTFASFESFLSFLNVVDDNMYNVVPKHLHDKYFLHFQDTLKKRMITICQTTGNATFKYSTITIHAIKN